MAQYLLNIIQPDGPAPAPAALEPIMRNVGAFLDETKTRGAWVFSGGLTPAGSATTVRIKDDSLMLTDGPFSEGKEHIGGFVIVKANDLDEALEWANKLSRATTLPTEVRAFQHVG